MSDSKVFEGICEWFSNTLGYGFIARSDGKGDIFVHYSNIVSENYKTLKQGQKVSFVMGENKKGPQAEQVVVLEG